MRVIAGEARGRPLSGPASAITRPTSDLLRGAIFSMLESRGAFFTRVLDLFAGTGAMGIEALSRGAEWADFFEQDRRACAILTSNLRATGLIERGEVYCASLPGGLDRVREPYGLIFLDPPYQMARPDTLFQGIGGGLLDEETTIVYEHGHRTIPPANCGTLPLQITRCHGTTAVSLYYYGGGSSEHFGGTTL